MPKIDYNELKRLSEEVTRIKIDIVPHLKEYDQAYDAFVADKSLSGLAWDSGKSYHENYKTLSDALFNGLYDLDDTLKAHLAMFESLVGTAENKLDTDEMQDLLTQLRNLQTQKLQFMEEMAKAFKDVPVLKDFFGQQTMFGTASEIELLKRYEQFEQTTAHNFDGVHETIKAILEGLAYLGNSKNFENGSKGYNAASLEDLAWHKTLLSYNEANQEDRYEIVEIPVDNKGNTEPFIYKNGVMDDKASAEFNKVNDKKIMALLQKEGPELIKILLGLDDVEVILDEDSTGLQKSTSSVFILMSLLPTDKVKDIIKGAKLLKDGEKSLGAVKLTTKEYKLLKEVETSSEVGKIVKKESSSVKKTTETIKIPKIDVAILKESANLPKKGGETVVGHALQKHAGRNPDIWGKIKGNAEEINKTATKHLEDILNAEGDFKVVQTKKGVSFLEKQLPDGRGIRLNMDGSFKGFIDQIR